MSPDGVPIVCGGSEDNVGVPGNECARTHDECYRYLASSNTWEQSGTMSTPRRWMAHTYSENAGLTLFGGENEDCDKLDSVENTKDGLNFTGDGYLPRPGLVAFCAATISDDEIVIVGGRRTDDSYSDDAYIYSRPSGVWTYVGPMPTARAHLGCGAVKRSDGSVDIVTAGGWTDTATSVVEIYNTVDRTWRTGEEEEEERY